MRLSIIIPCYNEAENLPLLLERFKTALTDHTDIEIILVNNGSTDATATILEKLLPQYPFARTTTVTMNQGYGFGIICGLKAAQGEYLGWTHADLQTDPRDVIRAYDVIAQRNAPSTIFIKGRRCGRAPIDTFFTIGMSIFESLFLKTWLWDINAQPTVFHKSFYMQWQDPPHDFSLDLYAYYLARKKKLSVQRIPVTFPERLHGTSHWNTGFAAKWKFITRTLAYSRTLKKSLLR